MHDNGKKHNSPYKKGTILVKETDGKKIHQKTHNVYLKNSKHQKKKERKQNKRKRMKEWTIEIKKTQKNKRRRRVHTVPQRYTLIDMQNSVKTKVVLDRMQWNHTQ